MRPFDPEAFEATMREQPAAISFHIGDPRELVARSRYRPPVAQQVFDTDQAHRTADPGVDVITVQGGEAGGNGGLINAMVMVPANVDIAGGIPVVAADGIALDSSLS
jgi:enoyl-[acyl-carrier protein] reductase II